MSVRGSYLLSIDWLQVFGYSDYVSEGTFLSPLKVPYVLEKCDYGTSVFSDRYICKQNRRAVATILQSPRSSVIPSKTTLVKLENSLLYSSDYLIVLFDILSTFNINYKGISRLDLAYDCNEFVDYNPQDFIRDFLLNDSKSDYWLYRKGGSKFTVFAEKNHNTSACSFQSIRFSSTSSRVSAYLYDKSLELKQVKDKAYIRRAWKAANLKNTDDTHVFRFEISVKSSGFDILNLETAQLFKCDLEMIEHQTKIETLFMSYANKYAQFRKVRGVKKSRYTKVKLFDLSDNTCLLPHNRVVSLDSGRTEKLIANRIDKVAKEYEEQTTFHALALRATREFFDNLSSAKRHKLRANAFNNYKYHVFNYDEAERARLMRVDLYMRELIDESANRISDDLSNFDCNYRY